MKIGAIIICRFNSSRLPGKILKRIKGQEILLHIYNRLNLIKDLNVLVATSVEQTDEPISIFCQVNSIPCFRGSLNKVSKRFLDAAQSINLDYAIRVNGDNLFIDINTMQQMITLAKRNVYDFISNVKGRSFPYGMSIEILKTSFYNSIFTQLNTEYYQEHVTIYLYENENIGAFIYVYNTEVKKAKGLKIAIDTIEDFDKATEIAGQIDLLNYDLKEIAEAYE